MSLPTTGPISAADFNTDAGFAGGTPFILGGTVETLSVSF